MNTRSWLEHFRTNEPRRPAALTGAIALPERLRAPLADALRTFQAGETGEGRIVQQARLAAPADPDFQEALRLYIAEEGRHARELGLLIRAVGGSEHVPVATARAFAYARRAIGFWTKMAILTAAEVVGILFYDLLAERIPSPELAAIVANISHEERAHVLFQRDAFEALAGRAPAPLASASRGLVAATLGAAIAASVGVFAADQRRLLAVLGVTPAELAGRASAIGLWVLETPSDHVRRRSVPVVEVAAASLPRGGAPFAWLDVA